MHITLANKITIFRIFNVPIFVLLLLYYKHSVKVGAPYELYRYFATAVFSITICLDIIDGYLARKRNEISKLGRVLDPLADKSLLVSAFILLSSNSIGTDHSHLPLWFVLLVISRDIVLVTGALLINYVAGTIRVQARIFGKAATFFQTMVILLVLFKIQGQIFIGCITCTAVCTLVSGIQYCIDGYHQIESI